MFNQSINPIVWSALRDYLRNPYLTTELFKSYLKAISVCSILARCPSTLGAYMQYKLTD